MNEELVKNLESLVELAKAGILTGVSYAGTKEDGTYAVGWVAPVRPLELLGVTTLMKDELSRLILVGSAKENIFPDNAVQAHEDK